MSIRSASRLLLAAALVACGGAKDASPRPDAAARRASAASAPASGAVSAAVAPAESPGAGPPPEFVAALGDLPRTEMLARYGSRADSSDLGLALVEFFGIPPTDATRYPFADTLVLREAPRGDARAVGGVVIWRETRGIDEAEVRLAGLPGVRSNLRQYGIDQADLPADSIAGDWARTVVGWDGTGARVLGWVPASEMRGDAYRVQLLRWDQFFGGLRYDVALLPGARVYASLDDTTGAGEPPPAERYELATSAATQGRWRRVRLRWGYDGCRPGRAVDAAMQARDVWIANYDPRGRPLLRFAPEAC